MIERKSANKNNSRRQTQWDGLFVSEHAWDSDNDAINDPQPMLSAEEKQGILDILIVACDRKCTVFIQSWQGRHFHYHRCTIQGLDWEQRSITYEESF